MRSSPTATKPHGQRQWIAYAGIGLRHTPVGSQRGWRRDWQSTAPPSRCASSLEGAPDSVKASHQARHGLPAWPADDSDSVWVHARNPSAASVWVAILRLRVTVLGLEPEVDLNPCDPRQIYCKKPCDDAEETRTDGSSELGRRWCRASEVKMVKTLKETLVRVCKWSNMSERFPRYQVNSTIKRKWWGLGLFTRKLWKLILLKALYIIHLNI